MFFSVFLNQTTGIVTEFFSLMESRQLFRLERMILSKFVVDHAFCGYLSSEKSSKTIVFYHLDDWQRYTPYYCSLIWICLFVRLFLDYNSLRTFPLALTRGLDCVVVWRHRIVEILECTAPHSSRPMIGVEVHLNVQSHNMPHMPWLSMIIYESKVECHLGTSKFIIFMRPKVMWSGQGRRQS